ncbi:MAG: hypothetical protein IKY83_04785 [Proteobacteria bacterium]|nr:hypothetical protein [Pseudomonadota bacterium]
MKYSGYLFFWICMMMLLSSGNVYGEDCMNLYENQMWRDGIDKMIASVNEHNYKDAIDVASKLYPECRKSPVLNYYTGLALQGQGEREQALIYFQKASDFTSEMEVDPGMARRIWYARYEAEHPECSQSSMLEQTREIAKLKIENAQHREKGSVEEGSESEWKLLWTGAGLGIAGLVLTGAGAALGMNVDNISSSGGTTKISPLYLSGWSAFGVGVGMVVSGTIMTAVAGYRYTHHKDSRSFSYQIGPSSAAFMMVF